MKARAIPAGAWMEPDGLRPRWMGPHDGEGTVILLMPWAVNIPAGHSWEAPETNHDPLTSW